jgi:hypothetical protein
MGDDGSAPFSSPNVGYGEVYSWGASTSSNSAAISRCGTACPSYRHVMYHDSVPRALLEPLTISPSSFSPAWVEPGLGVLLGIESADEKREHGRIPAQEPPPVESPCQGLTECPSFHLPLSLEPSDAPGDGYPIGHVHEGSNIDLRDAVPWPHDTTSMGPLRASSEM